MADIVSSDGHCTVRLHTAWASVLVWTDLTGTITVRRNGVDVATLAPARMIWYDHYPAMGAATSYTVTNGSTTSTAATITVPSDLRRRFWLKSGIDPNLSQLVVVTSLGTVEYERHRGVFMPLQTPGSTALRSPFIIEAGMSMRARPLTMWTGNATTRDNILALIAAGPLLVSFVPEVQEIDMWASADSPKVTRHGTIAPNVGWTIETDLTETTQPAASKRGDIIPGWGWDQVKVEWATWNAEKAANATWLDLVKYGVTDAAGPAVPGWSPPAYPDDPYIDGGGAFTTGGGIPPGGDLDGGSP